MQIDDSSIETVAAKCAFEAFAAQRGIRIQHYHCDNGRFSDNAFKQACHDARQQLTFCGVNAHFQNGIAERSIRDLSESARKQLLHARARWPAAVHFALWPYALRNAALLHNNLPVLEDGTSRLELFSSIRVGANMKHMHTFGCPVFALQNALASGKQLPRWSPRARLGLNLGPSPMHARNVYLVLNLSTGCVSPQYHCRFDDFFETTRHNGPDVSGTISWQLLAGLNRAEMILSEVSTPTQHSVMYPEMQSEANVPSEEMSVTPPPETVEVKPLVPDEGIPLEPLPSSAGDAATLGTPLSVQNSPPPAAVGVTIHPETEIVSGLNQKALNQKNGSTRLLVRKKGEKTGQEYLISLNNSLDQTANPEGERPLELVADEQEFDQNRQIITARGNVTLRFAQSVLTADRLQINLPAKAGITVTDRINELIRAKITVTPIVPVNSPEKLR